MDAIVSIGFVHSTEVSQSIKDNLHKSHSNVPLPICIDFRIHCVIQPKQ